MGLLDGTVLIPPGVSISQKLNRGRVSHDGRAFNPGSRTLYLPNLLPRADAGCPRSLARPAAALQPATLAGRGIRRDHRAEMTASLHTRSRHEHLIGGREALEVYRPKIPAEVLLRPGPNSQAEQRLRTFV